jgi:hypothetical protein
MSRFALRVMLLLAIPCAWACSDPADDPAGSSARVSINQDPKDAILVKMDFWAVASLTDYACKDRTIYQIDDEPVYFEFSEGWAAQDTYNGSDDTFALAPGTYRVMLLGRQLLWENGQPAGSFLVSQSLDWPLEFFAIDGSCNGDDTDTSAPDTSAPDTSTPDGGSPDGGAPLPPGCCNGD